MSRYTSLLKKLSTGLLGAFLMVSCAPATAEFVSVGRLKQALAGGGELSLVAQGYILGVVDATWGVAHCAPNTLKADKALAAVTGFMAKLEDDDKTSADQAITYLFSKAYPCPTKGVTL